MSDYRQKHERRPVSRQTKLMDVLWKVATPWRNIFSWLRPRLANVWAEKLKI